MISGGLGRLRSSIARWMGTRNARHFMLLSRSGAGGEAALTLLQELEAKSIEVVAPPCDITDERALVATLGHFKEISTYQGLHSRINTAQGKLCDPPLCATHSKVLPGQAFRKYGRRDFQGYYSTQRPRLVQHTCSSTKWNTFSRPSTFNQRSLWMSWPKRSCRG